MSEQSPILYCRCAFAKVLPDDVKDGVLQRLVDSELPFDSVPDLCEMSAKNDPALKEIAAQANVCIVACYPRAVRWLFDAAGAPLAPQRVKILNMRTESVDNVWDGILAARAGNPATPDETTPDLTTPDPTTLDSANEGTPMTGPNSTETRGTTSITTQSER